MKAAIAWFGSQRFFADVFEFDGGHDPAEHRLSAMSSRMTANSGQVTIQLTANIGEGPSFKWRRRQNDFEIEARQLFGISLIVEFALNFFANPGHAIVRSDELELLLHAKMLAVGFAKAATLDQFLQEIEIFQDAVLKPCPALSIEKFFNLYRAGPFKTCSGFQRGFGAEVPDE